MKIKSLLLALTSALIAIGVVATIASSGPEPSVGLYYYAAVNPTLAPGVCAPQWQLLVRTDIPQLYAHTGTTCTAWTLIGTGSSSGGTVTGTGTANTVTKWTSVSAIGNSAATDNGTTFSIGTGATFTESNGAASVRELDLPSFVTATNLTGGTVNNWDPTAGSPGSLSGIERINVAPTSNTTVTGLIIGNGGQLISVHNTSTTTSITFTNQGAGSTSANRFSWPNAGSMIVGPGGAITLRTSATSSGWNPWSSGTQNQSGTTTDLVVFTDTNQIGNYAGSSPTACTAGNVVSASALSAAGALTTTCTAIGTQGGVTGTGTTSTVPKFTSSTAIGNSSVTDDATTWAINVNKVSVVEASGNTTIAGTLASGTHTVTGAETISTTLGVTGASTLTGGATVTAGLTTDSLNVGVIAPSISTTQNDWAPTGINTAAIINVNIGAQLNITGIQAPTGSVAGRVLCVQNTGANTASFLNQSASSSAANRFVMVGAVTWTAIAGNSGSVCFWYDSAASRWNQIGKFGFPQLTAGSSSQFTVSAAGIIVGATESLSGVSGNPAIAVTDLTLTDVSTFALVADTNSTGINSTITSTRLSGAFNLTNRGGFFSASGAQINQALVADVGDVQLGHTSGAIEIAAGAGAVTIGGNVTISGTKTLTVGGDVVVSTTKNKGTISLSSGTGTATVLSGSICTCTDTTTANLIKCAVATTTLTATGTASDVIAYLCF